MQEFELKNIYTKENIDFISAASDFCLLMENVKGKTKKEVVERLLLLLPQLYFYASIIDANFKYSKNNILLEEYVKEQDYNYIRENLLKIFKEDDDYLDVVNDDMKYSEAPITKSISEDLADIYQDIKNCIWIFSKGNKEASQEAINEVCSLFEIHWGGRLVSTTRALHYIKYNCQTSIFD